MSRKALSAHSERTEMRTHSKTFTSSAKINFWKPSIMKRLQPAWSPTTNTSGHSNAISMSQSMPKKKAESSWKRAYRVRIGTVRYAPSVEGELSPDPGHSDSNRRIYLTYESKDDGGDGGIAEGTATKTRAHLVDWWWYQIGGRVKMLMMMEVVVKIWLQMDHSGAQVKMRWWCDDFDYCCWFWFWLWERERMLTIGMLYPVVWFGLMVVVIVGQVRFLLLTTDTRPIVFRTKPRRWYGHCCCSVGEGMNRNHHDHNCVILIFIIGLLTSLDHHHHHHHSIHK